MQLTNRELWTLIHGMGLGALFLLAFAGGLAGFYSLRPEWLTTAGLRERIIRLGLPAATTPAGRLGAMTLPTPDHGVLPDSHARAARFARPVRGLT